MAFDVQENNKVGFDMTKVQVGDELVRRNGTSVYLAYVNQSGQRHLLSDGNSVTKDGYYLEDGIESDYDIIGFADENQHTSDTSEEMQAVELLLSLGYTLKKGA